jgi:type I restriction enzyme M protein
MELTEEELIAKAIDYNSFLHNYSIPEVERCTLISAILIALQHEAFLKSYTCYKSNKELIEALLFACKSVLEHNKMDIEKSEVILSEYSKFKNNNDFSSVKIYNKKTKKDEINTLLRDFISSVSQDILPHINESEFDILGKFYTHFIRYAGSDKKTGLVLTPAHITDFFCDIAELSVNDIVFDPCCGTAGFLVSAMNYMLKKAGNDTEKQKAIKSNQLIGIEKRADMFSHACSNMMMRGDGKSHILYGNCFDEKNRDIIESHSPTKGFLNPPYQDGNASEQLEFIENTLECLANGGICVAICQMSTVVSDDKKVLAVKQRLLKKHTLEAVFSMPNDLFHPIGVNTCIIVFKAGNKHSDNKKTFFGYFKDDGFVKQKNSGRIDKNNKFEVIKKLWLEKYINKENTAGLSITKIVGAESEWCAEAYMETNYLALTSEDFIEKIHAYVSFLFSSKQCNTAYDKSFCTNTSKLNTDKWKTFFYKDILEITRGQRLIKNDREEGRLPYFSASEINNGCTDFISNPLFIEKNAIIYTTFGDAYYVETEFTASDEISIFKNKNLNKYNALFIATVIQQNKYKYAFGRKAFKNKFIKDKINLPVTPQGEPDWQFMENYIKSLPYSASL